MLYFKKKESIIKEQKEQGPLKLNGLQVELDAKSILEKPK